MLSKEAKYAINALVYIGHRVDAGPILISKISEDVKIPQKFLESILLKLKKALILNSKKGRGGGYFLIKDLDTINLADVIRIFDGPIALLPCVTHDYYKRCEECKDEATCGIRTVFLGLRNITVKHLKEATLEKVVDLDGNK